MGEEGDGPEGAINAWPLGEGLIDYVANSVDGDDGPEVPASVAGIAGNIIADTGDLSRPSRPSVIRDNFELGGDERNVSSGFHAIEFLLWGQDLNADGSGGGTRDATPGMRGRCRTTPCVAGGCTSGANAASDDRICERRGDYLLADRRPLDRRPHRLCATPGTPMARANHYASFVAGGDTSLALILEGMGRMGFGELAGERMNIALLTNSQEDEHSCFSDNTHRDIYLNAKGILNSFMGEYTGVGGDVHSGAGIDDLLATEGMAELGNEMRAALEDSMAKVGVIDKLAKAGRAL